MRLGRFRIKDVKHFPAPRLEIIRYQRAMTTPPDCLGTHDRCGPPSEASSSSRAIPAANSGVSMLSE